MSITKAVSFGLAGNELSKKITGSSKVSLGRTAVAVGSGAALGASAAGVVIVGATTVGLVATPVKVESLQGAVQLGRSWLPDGINLV